MQAYLSYVRALLHTRCVLVFLYSSPTGSVTHGSVGALSSGEAGFRAVGHMVAP
jgi:hypothetical protein